MKLDKNGYQSEKRDSFATAVKVLTFIFGLVVVVAAVCVYAMFSGCGSNGSGDEPIYDENGNCLNCSGNGDGYVSTVDNGQPSGDTPLTYADGKPIPQPDTVPYVCPVSEPPEVCTPKWDEEPVCDLFATPPVCYRGFFEGQPCTSDADCQKIPPDKYPPCVCWGLPCLLVGKWFWASPSGGPFSCADFSNAKFYDNGDGYCRVDLYDNGGELYYKPGDDHLQGSPSGSAEEGYYPSEDGSQLKTSPDDTDPYERASEQTWQTWCQ